MTLSIGDLGAWTVAIVTILTGVLFLYNHYQLKQIEKQYLPQGEFVTVEGLKLHYICKGNPSGKAVVFLHGGVLHAHDFDNVIDLAAKAGYYAISFDRPGYGHSERPINKIITPIDQARLLYGALKQLQIEQPIIVSHSWSGVLALAYASYFPHHLSGIITLGGAMYKEGYPAENGDPISRLVTTPIVGSLIMHTLLQSPLGRLLGKAILIATFAPEHPPKGYEEALLNVWFRPRQFRANREDILAFPPTAFELSQAYRDIKADIIIVVGEDDPFGTIEQAHRLNNELPQSRLLLLPNVAHMIPQNHPQIVFNVIESFNNANQ